MYTQNTFRQRCEEAAKRFLNSVVVIDNEAKLYDGEVTKEQSAQSSAKNSDEENTPSETKTKPKKLAGRPARGISDDKLKESKATKPTVGETTEIAPTEAAPGSGDDEGQAEETVDHELKAWVLTAGLADQEILCTVYRPDDFADDEGGDSDEDVVRRSVGMARLADIVVLDWELGDKPGEGTGSWKAREIIKEILREDNEIQGRLRLITVYTAQRNLDSVFGDVSGDLEDLDLVNGELQRDEKNLVLSNATTRISFLNKKQTVSPDEKRRVKSEEDLPQKLVEEFTNLSLGLVPSITLHSIAAIRENTHHLLAIFNSRLDPALVCHRSLLPTPQDSEEFILDLIAGELRSVLSLNRVGEAHADDVAHKHWIGSRLKEGKSFELGSVGSLTRDEAFALVTGGQREFEKARVTVAKRWAEKKIATGEEFNLASTEINVGPEDVEKLIENDLGKGLSPTPTTIEHGNLTGLLIANKSGGQQTDCEFSRLTSLKREFFGGRRLPEKWAPRMTQGTIIRYKGSVNGFTYLLCTQPRCDSARFEKGREFPFLILEQGGSGPAGTKQLLFVRAPKRDGDPAEDIKLWVSPFPYRQKMIHFEPSTESGGMVEATFADDKWIFEDGEASYEWVADMKDFLAQKICDQVSGRQGAVGLDEYEWLRRQSRD